MKNLATTVNHHPTDAGFHPGELAVQQKAGVGSEAARLSGMVEPARLSGGFAGFLARQTFLVITGRDAAGRLWTSPLAGPPGFLEAHPESRSEHSDNTITIHTEPPAGDPLRHLPPDQKLGMTAIDFAARRRVRVNGVLRSAADGRLIVQAEQAFGNCPQYIPQRRIVAGEPDRTSALPLRTGTALAPDDAALIQQADSFFLGTVNPERGADASHRGGPRGFVRVSESGLRWPDLPGNNMFTSLGNLAVHPEAALLFLDFRTGRTLHLSGTADVEWGEPGRAGDDGRTGRIVRFSPDRLVAGRGLPARELRA